MGKREGPAVACPESLGLGAAGPIGDTHSFSSVRNGPFSV